MSLAIYLIPIFLFGSIFLFRLSKDLTKERKSDKEN